jgi:SAM-dependent methyltransferase
MSTEFTGERVIPGQVDTNLWNEHMARYAFAARMARGRRVLDAGCGAGYGSAELASVALSVTALDVAAEAIGWAKEHYAAANLRWTRGSGTQLPFQAGSFDLVVAFEVIEHLNDWPKLLDEVKRVLAPGGRFLVSTPNKSFYARTRETAGPNRFHEHEFEFDEFRDALQAIFPDVSVFLEDPSEGVVFRPMNGSGCVDAAIESGDLDPQIASFYVALCALEPQAAEPAFVYIPRAANLLAEKLLHIERLEDEVAKKDRWLEESQAAHTQLLEAHKKLQTELEERNRWAADLNGKLAEARQYIDKLQQELVTQATEMAAGYEAQIADMETELRSRTDWAKRTEAELAHQTAELGRSVEALHETEATLQERTRWAQELNEKNLQLEGKIQAAQLSRWLRLGRAIGVGPELNRP